MSTTTYMLLTLPTVGSANDFTGEQQFVTALQTIDAHDHSSGKGTPVHVAGLLIDADLTFGAFNATNLRTVRFSNQSSVPALLTDVACLAVSGGNLYYVNSSGQAVQITSGAALSATSLGGISGLSAPASAAFGSSTFSWRSGTNIAATMDGGPIVIRDVGVSALGITIASPAGLSAGYSITLPAALPGSTGILALSSTGVLAATPVTGLVQMVGGVLSGFGTLSGSNLTVPGSLTAATSMTITTSGSSAELNVTSSNAQLTLRGNRSAADSGPDVVLTSTANRSAGSLFKAQNFGSDKLVCDYQGLLTLGSQTAPLQPSSIYTAVTFNSTWFSPGGLSYWKDASGVVRVKGPAQSLASPPTNPVFTFPAGFRPAATRLFPCWSTILSAFVNVQVASNGQVSVSAINASDTYYLDSIEFAAEG